MVYQPCATMNNGAIATEEYWGYLIKDDKSPSPVFEQLLLGIANYIVRLFPPSCTAKAVS